MLPNPTPRLRFREMTGGDLADIARLELGGTRGSQGWIEWNRRNYVELGFGLWVVETNSGGFVGDCGLTMQEVEGSGWSRRGGMSAPTCAARDMRPARIGLVLEREVHKNGGPALVFGATLAR